MSQAMTKFRTYYIYNGMSPYDLSNATWRRVLVQHLPVFIDQSKEPHNETALEHEHRHSASCWEVKSFARLSN